MSCLFFKLISISKHREQNTLKSILVIVYVIVYLAWVDIIIRSYHWSFFLTVIVDDQDLCSIYIWHVGPLFLILSLDLILFNCKGELSDKKAQKIASRGFVWSHFSSEFKCRPE